ncbi:hypothetical protein B296_00021997 [Ensete ventricosum]|uniref:Uncharacterized protein n=1 Tax=Ensete ventricosum TaxID=4639 RepID=A0A427AK26_ENSVE|nr:hypothetical protein B296_00021997 [Ensete ventricosum]
MKRLLLPRLSSSLTPRRRFSGSAAAVAGQNAAAAAGLPNMPPFDYTPPPYDGPSAAEILRKRSEFLSPSMFYFYKKPVPKFVFRQLNIVDGKMQYLFDEDGRRYLDAFGGIATVCCGHCHPEVIEAIINQMKRLQHSTVLYLNHAIADFAEALASKLPGDLKGIGNGIPIGAVVTTPEIAQVLTYRNYFNTFGGNPVCTAGGHAVLKVLEKEKLQENALVVGSSVHFIPQRRRSNRRFEGPLECAPLLLPCRLNGDPFPRPASRPSPLFLSPPSLLTRRRGFRRPPPPLDRHQARHGTRAPTKKRIKELDRLAIRLDSLLSDAKQKTGKDSLQKIPAWLWGWQSPWKGRERGGELIIKGEEELYKLGIRVRERFPQLFDEEYHPDTFRIMATQVPRASASAVAFGMGIFAGKGTLGPGQHRSFSVISESRASDIHLRFFDTCETYKVSLLEWTDDIEAFVLKGYGESVNYRMGVPLLQDVVLSMEQAISAEEGLWPKRFLIVNPHLKHDFNSVCRMKLKMPEANCPLQKPCSLTCKLSNLFSRLFRREDHSPCVKNNKNEL